MPLVLFLDTSALLKRYVAEKESEQVIELMNRDREWCASALGLGEGRVTICHLGFDEGTRATLVTSLQADWDRFLVVPLDDLCLAKAIEIGCQHQVRTLDAIHLAAADRLPRPTSFATFDRRQAAVAAVLGLEVVGASC